MSFDRAVAHFVSQRPRTVYASLAGVVLISVALLLCFVRLDSEVLDLLPTSIPSVAALKVYNDQFTQGRELTFGLLDEDHSTDIDGFTEYFGDLLKKEPWVARVMDRSPMENADGMQDVQAIALPLLFGLPEAEFDQALALLEPSAIQARLHKLRSEIDAGSPRAEMQLNFDPLGVITRALKPLAVSFSVEQTRPLVSPDGKLHVVLVEAKQKGLGVRTARS